MDIKETFYGVLGKYTSESTIDVLWADVEKCYTGKSRFYHTLVHLQHLHLALFPFKDKIQNWDAVIFAIVYHDIVYDAVKADNEERSALYAQEVLHNVSVNEETIIQCTRIIRATKTHGTSEGSDISLFLDADLSILGQPWNIYDGYCKAIRKEYAVYPDFLYIPGRLKVLHHFLKMQFIYKTDEFCSKYEDQARDNISKEIRLLT